MNNSQCVIWGAGAMGGTLAAYWIRAGFDVILVDSNQEHVNAINSKGLTISGPIETFSVPAKAYLPEQLAQNFSHSFEHIFLCTKALHTEKACEQLRPFLSPTGVVISVQNGLNEHTIARIVGQQRTLGCFINFGADILEPGHIHYAGRGAVVLGEMDGSISDRAQTILEWMKQFEPNAIVTDRIFSFLWGKLAYGALLFATALTNDSIVDILHHPKYRSVLIALAKEVCAVAKAQDIPLEGFNGFNPDAFTAQAPIELSHASIDDMVAFNRKSAKTHSGIWRDLAIHKRKTEVNEQLGVIIKIASECGINTPLLSALVDGIHLIEDGQPLCASNLENLIRINQI
ncbi:ketopantoate reductase family protein [Thorsellia anophelis]|uniref:2-dehydropantoate 2-reductase n=1 Tax=Thorsellia anophelis DSM 18579 TaxID=1123402 RepID=A0A1H9ZE21_9GAMM|nr:ketopantoate reductase family protein [Thorsellia anophelis]SES79733.1 2-dehydropantoate 2-reductase [Thorsellia anophelis DSM 18579]